MLGLSFLISYALGALPSGRIIGALFGVDVREKGSGNVGATNVARTVGKKAGLITLALDITKGILAPLLTWHFLMEDYVPIAMVAVVLGHCLSIPGVLKGGKGVATALGAACFGAPSSAAGALLAFACVFKGSKIVSLSSIIAVFVAPIMALSCGYHANTIWALCGIACIVSTRHHENIGRLLRGEEKAFSSRKQHP